MHPPSPRLSGALLCNEGCVFRVDRCRQPCDLAALLVALLGCRLKPTAPASMKRRAMELRVFGQRGGVAAVENLELEAKVGGSAEWWGMDHSVGCHPIPLYWCMVVVFLLKNARALRSIHPPAPTSPHKLLSSSPNAFGNTHAQRHEGSFTCRRKAPDDEGHIRRQGPSLECRTLTV